MSTVYVIYRMESVGQYDYRQDQPVFVSATLDEDIVKTYVKSAEKLGVDVFVEELELE